MTTTQDNSPLHEVERPAPPNKTRAQAYLDLVHASKAFSMRQTDTTFQQLAAAVAVARALKLY